MWVARFIDALPRILHDHPTAKFIHLTLTVRNCDVKDLRETLGLMNDAWKRLTHRKQFPAIGWVKAIEVTRNDDEGSEWHGTAHPHIHALLMVTPTYFSKHYLSQEKWVDLWQSCLKVSYRPSVDVRTIKPKNPLPPSIPPELRLTPDQLEPPFSSLPLQPPPAKVPNELVKAACEVLKYTVKPQDLVIGGSWLVDLTEQLHKTRAIATGGVFKDYLANVEENSEDLTAAKELIEAELGEPIMFNWKDKVKRYRQA